MHIDRKTLHLVIPLEREGGAKVYVHSTPVDRAVYDRYWRAIETAYCDLMMGPMRGRAYRLAMRALRQTAADDGMPADVLSGLVEEIKRLTNVTAPTPQGWQTLPLTQAVAAGLLDEEEADQVENNIAFFTCYWHTTDRVERARTQDGLAKALAAQMSPLDCTEHANSLRTSTEPEPSGPRAPQPSIPV